MRQPHTDYVSPPDRSVRVFLYHVGDNKGNTAFGKVFFALNILSILDFASGLALFLFGMNVMGESLRRLSGGRPQGWLGRLCRTPLRGVALGAVATAIVQSSSAITVMVVGFVNSGIMTLSQSVGVIMGANLGTTFTSWVLSLTQLGGTAELFSPAAVASVLAAVGIVFIMDSRTGRRRDLGYAFRLYRADIRHGADERHCKAAGTERGFCAHAHRVFQSVSGHCGGGASYGDNTVVLGIGRDIAGACRLRCAHTRCGTADNIGAKHRDLPHNASFGARCGQKCPPCGVHPPVF